MEGYKDVDEITLLARIDVLNLRGFSSVLLPFFLNVHLVDIFDPSSYDDFLMSCLNTCWSRQWFAINLSEQLI